eukprot:TRINITY_DN7898_c0_g1_i29.p1 TRINITY_DN7898_c0_g1~~TRINITY_DN7898_c0_g1_i29.p1  ORF type:complete len:381 (-),score=66.02 TRINITY_DN7898_c0_g1_i29:259-1401(-)
MLGFRTTKSLDRDLSASGCQNDTSDSVLVFALLNPTLFSKRLTAGPPSTFRWTSWKAALNVSIFFVPGKYERLKSYKGRSRWLGTIVQDVARTFSRHLHSCEALENILAAYSMYNETVGYCQGMNYVAGLLLLVSGLQEEEAFWVFVALMEQRVSFDRLPLCGLKKLFVANFPLVKLFEELFVKLLDKDLLTHFNTLGLPIELWFHKWISSLFLYSFPIHHCIRFWDAMMGNGISYFLPLACAILNKLTPKLREATTIEKCNEILKIPQELLVELFPDPEDIINSAGKLNIKWKSLKSIAQKHTSCVTEELFHKPTTRELLQQFRPITSHNNKELLEPNIDDRANLLDKSENVKVQSAMSSASTKAPNERSNFSFSQNAH